MSDAHDQELTPEDRLNNALRDSKVPKEELSQMVAELKRMVAELVGMAPIIKDIEDRNEIRNEEDLVRFLREGEAAAKSVQEWLRKLQDLKISSEPHESGM